MNKMLHYFALAIKNTKLSSRVVMLLLGTMLLLNSFHSQAQLVQGDLLFTGYDSSPLSGANGPSDRFSFVLLAPISSGTVIYFTDRGYFSTTGAYQASNGVSEGVIQWTSSGALALGTEILVTLVPSLNSTTPEASIGGVVNGTISILSGRPQGGLSLANTGDQIIAFQGGGGEPSAGTLIAGVNWNRCGVTASPSTSTSTWDIFGQGGCNAGPNSSSMPPGLTGGVGAFYIGDIVGNTTVTVPQAVFNKNTSFSPTAAGIKAAVMDPNNWTKSASTTPDATIVIPSASAFSTPTITSATYDASTGSLVVTATNLVAGATIVVSNLIITGEGGFAYTLTSPSVTASSTTQFSVVVNAADLASLAANINNNGTSSTSSTAYGIGAFSGWYSTAPADQTGNPLTASNVPLPIISSATYNASNGFLAVSGANFKRFSGVSNDIIAGKFTLTGYRGNTFTLTSPNADISSSTNFTIILSAADRLSVSALLNKNGTSAIDGTAFNLAASEDWNQGANPSSIIADLTGNVVTVGSIPSDNTPPTVVLTSTSGASGSAVGNGTFNFTATFSEQIDNFTANDISLTNGLVVGQPVAIGNAFNFNVTASTPSVPTTVTIPGGAVGDGGGNTNASSNTYSITYTPITVNSISLVNSAVNNLNSVSFTLVFSGPVSGLNITNFSIVTTGVSGVSFGSLSGSGDTYTISLNTGSGSGTIRLNLANSTGISPTVTSLPYTSGPTYTIDRTSPTVASVGVPANSTYNSNLDFTVNFSEAVTVNTTGGTPTLALTVGSTTRTAAYVSGSGTSQLVFRHTVVAGDSDNDGVALGSAISLNGGSITDGAGNSAALTLNNVGSLAGVLVDKVSPTVTITSSAGASGSNTSTSPIPFAVTFSESVTGFVAGDVTVTGGNIGTVSGSGITYTFNVTPTGAGAVTVAVPAVVAQDASGNGNTAATTFSITYEIPATVVSITRSGAATTNAASVTYSLIFDKAITGIGLNNFSLTATGISGAFVSGVGNVSGTQKNVFVNTGSGSGTLRLNLQNTNNLTPTVTGLPFAGETYTIDRTSPTVASVGVPANSTYNSDLDFTVNFSEVVTMNTTGGTPTLALTVGSTARTASYVSGSGTSQLVFSHTIIAGDSDNDGVALGSAISLNGGSITDAAGNSATLTLNNVGNLGGVLVDKVNPTVVISSTAGPSGANTSVSPIQFTVTFSENVTGFVAGDLSIGNGNPSGFSGSGTTYNFNITPAANGLVTVTVPAAVAQDAVGNTNTASGTFTLNYTQPVTVAPVALTPANGAVLSLLRPSYTGTAAANSTVTVYIDGTAIGITTTNGSGIFSLQQPSDLPQGSHTVKATAQASGQSVSADSNTNNFTIDTIDPAAPSAPVMSAASDTGVRSNDRITAVITPTFTGTAEAGSTVSLFDTDGTTLLGSAVATGGNWSIVSSALSQGMHTLTVRARDAAGNYSAASSGLAVTIDRTAPTVSVSANPSSVSAGQATTLSFTFSEDVVGFDTSVISVSGGTVSNLTNSGNVYNATFTPTTGYTGSASISVNAAGYSDVAGNAGTAGSVGIPVNAIAQVLTFFPASDSRVYGSADYDPGATSSHNDVAFPIIYSTSDVSIASIVAGRVRINKVGTVMIYADQAAGGIYTAAARVSQQLTITPRILTVGATANNKVYDGSGNAAVTLSDNRRTGDVLTIAQTSALFDNKNVGQAKTVTISGITVTGAGAGNYTFNTTTSAIADVTARSLVVSATASNRIYDGGSNATVTLSDNRITGDVLNLANATASFDNKNVGVAKPVSVTGISVTGTDAGNYSFNSAATAAANISVRPLVVSATASNKAYDGSNTATVVLSDNRITGDVITVANTTATFNNKNVGVAKPVAVSGITVMGTDAGNYTFNTSASATADITGKMLVVSATAANKIYDGSTSATVTLADNRTAGDVFTVASTAANFDNKNVGTGKAVSVTGITVSGADAGNYSFNTTATATADVTARPLLVSATAANKVYDGGVSATATLSDNRVTGDVLTIANTTATFNNKNVGAAKVVSVTGISVAGTDAGNYNFNTTANASAAITSRALLVSATAANKAYDGNNTATVVLSDNRITGDVLTVANTTATFDNKNVGAAKPATVSGITVTGNDAGNYSFNTTAAATADITGKVLVVSATAANKVYDGTTTASVSLTDNRPQGDVLTVSNATANFNNKNVGTSKTVSVTGITVTGADAGNYSFNTTASATADVTERPLLVSATAPNKIYDGSLNAIITLSDNRITGDVLSLTNATASFSNKNVGVAKPVSVTGISVTGTDAGNYSFNTTAAASANITVKPLIVSATASSKAYDGNSTATVVLSDNRVTGDVIAVANATATFNNKNVGVAKPVAVSGISVTGTDAVNYSFNTTASASADITGKVLLVSATAANKIYDGSTLATVTLADNRTAGDDLTVASTAANFNNKNVGTGKAVSVTGITVTGAGAGNYTFNTTTSAIADVTARSLVVSATASNRIYDGGSNATVTLSDNRVTGDVLTLANSTASFGNKNVGVVKPVSVTGISVTGTDAGNYSFNSAATATANISVRPLVVSATASNKAYDGSNTATVVLSDNRITGDVITVANTTATFNNKNVGVAKPVAVSGITITGTDAGNYSFNTTASASADITGKVLLVSASAANKVYDGTAAATVILSDNRTTGDVLTIGSAAANFNNKNVGRGKAVSVTGITVTGTDAANYSFNTTASATADVTARPLLVSATASNKIYDGGVGAAVTLSDNRVAGDLLTLAGATGVFANANAAMGKTVSVAGITVSGTDAANYTFNATTTTMASITPKALTITADNKDRFVGTANPALTASYSGFVNGETPTVLTSQPVLSTTAVTASPIGNYPITAIGAVAANYAISYVAGVLTVRPGAPSNVTLAAAPLFENQPAGTLAGTLSSVSADPSAVFTYSLVSGTGSTDNGLFAISGNQLRTIGTLDYETKNSFSVLLRSTTQYGQSLDQPFTISLGDVNELPTLAAIGDQTICYTTAGQNVALSGISSGPETVQTTTISVTSSNAALFQDLSVSKNGSSGALSYTAAAGAAGTALVTVTVRDNGGTANGGVDVVTRTFNVTINALPNLAIVSDKGASVSKGETIRLTASGGNSYVWANAAGIISGQNTAVLTVRPSVNTSYTVTATSAAGCSQTSSFAIEVASDFAKLNISNLLTPNGDGYNDKWIIENIDLYPNNSVRVFDKSGRTVYEKKGYDNSWEGTLRGVPLTEDTYYYIVDFGPGFGILKGFITILSSK